MDKLYAGILNDRAGLTAKLILADGTVKDGLSADWSETLDETARLELSFEKCYADRVELTFGKGTALVAAVLRGGGRALSRADAQTGGVYAGDMALSQPAGGVYNGGAVTLRADCVTDSLTVEIETYFSGVEITDISLYGATTEKCPLYPLPDRCEIGKKRFLFTGVSACGGARLGVSVLREKYAEITGVSLTDGGGIRFVRDESISNDGYRVSVTAQGATLGFASERGAVFAAEAFISLCDENGAAECEAELVPALPFRGVHLFMPSSRNMDFAKRLVKYLISPLGYNRIIIEVAGGMKFKSHPEINDAVRDAMRKYREGRGPMFPHGDVAEGEPVEQAEAARLAEYIRSFGIDVIPEIQSLGHVQFITAAHPEVAELAAAEETERADTREEDQRPEKLFPHCYCPSNEESYKILFDLADEIIDVFKPREYVHMGHDEVYEIGVCPRCRGKDPARLYADDVNRLYAYLKGKGLKMMIWSDMLQPVARYKTAPAADLIPKDILMLDFIWYFHFDRDIEDNLLAKGFSVVIGNQYSSHFPRYTRRAYKPGMAGGQISAWVNTEYESMDREGKYYDIMMTAQQLCGGYDPRLHCLYDRLICARIPRLRERLGGTRVPSLHGGKTVLFEGESRLEQPIELGVKADSLIFTHALTEKVTRPPWQDHPDVGAYLVRFTDGTDALFRLGAGKNIGFLRRRAHDPIGHKLYRHNGYTTGFFCDVINGANERGEPESRYLFEAVLPEGKTVSSVEFIKGKRDGGLAVYRIEAVK